MESSDQKNTSVSSSSEPAKKAVQFAVVQSSKNKLIMGIASLLFLVIGVTTGLFMIKLNQDLRQQADTGGYGADGCELNYHRVNGKCVLENCNDPDGDGIIVCGLDDDGLCTEDTLGGDWCDNPNTPVVEGCTGGMIRCQCGPGNDQGYWVIGVADSCDDLCEDAGVVCTDCPPNNPPEEPPPTTPPTRPPTPTPSSIPSPTPTSTPTPSPTPVVSECGYTPCTTDASCAEGLVCVTASDNNKYCSLPEYEDACIAEPGVEACCNEPTPSPTTMIGPQCRDIAMYNVTSGQSSLMSNNDDDQLVAGHSTVRFVCSSTQSSLPDGYFYAFRVYEPCGSDNHLEPLEFVNEEGENGINYNIDMYGDYMAQCSVCSVDEEGDTVCDWESLTPTACED